MSVHEQICFEQGADKLDYFEWRIQGKMRTELAVQCLDNECRRGLKGIGEAGDVGLRFFRPKCRSCSRLRHPPPSRTGKSGEFSSLDPPLRWGAANNSHAPHRSRKPQTPWSSPPVNDDRHCKKSHAEDGVDNSGNFHGRELQEHLPKRNGSFRAATNGKESRVCPPS